MTELGTQTDLEHFLSRTAAGRIIVEILEKVTECEVTGLSIRQEKIRLFLFKCNYESIDLIETL